MRSKADMPRRVSIRSPEERFAPVHPWSQNLHQRSSMDDKRNNQRDGDYRHHPIQRGDQPKPAHFGEIGLKNQPIIGLRQLASREAVLICINGPGCHTGSVSLRG